MLSSLHRLLGLIVIYRTLIGNIDATACFGSSCRLVHVAVTRVSGRLPRRVPASRQRAG